MWKPKWSPSKHLTSVWTQKMFSLFIGRERLLWERNMEKKTQFSIMISLCFFAKFSWYFIQTLNDTKSCLYCCSRAIFINEKGHKLSIYLKVKAFCDTSTSWGGILQSAFSALSWLYQIVSTQVQYLAHKLPKVPPAKWADVCNCLGSRVCVCVCNIGNEKKRTRQRKEDEERI